MATSKRCLKGVRRVQSQFEELGLGTSTLHIDDAVARVIRSEGGYIWACKTTTAT